MTINDLYIVCILCSAVHHRKFLLEFIVFLIRNVIQSKFYRKVKILALGSTADRQITKHDFKTNYALGKMRENPNSFFGKLKSRLGSGTEFCGTQDGSVSTGATLCIARWRLS
uniref:Uncharacterized protein n=1 Tax=Corethron hystrix TaxID=216773 RepID=A0A6U5M699_9STRA|mmetsp:Transcript_8676/g.19068  ORF Transcript_8676/g.19068 Transcript_8676/m.19068 type:complete len:113 (+) Transcript_8676:173-511(+)